MAAVPEAKQDGRQRYSTSDQGSDTRGKCCTHPALNLLQRPNKFWRRFRLFEISQFYQDLTGKCHWVITKSAGMPIGLWPVRPDRMQPVPDRENYLLGWIYTSPGGNETIALNADEVIYDPLPDPMDSYGGTGPMQGVMTEIDAVEVRRAVQQEVLLPTPPAPTASCAWTTGSATRSGTS